MNPKMNSASQAKLEQVKNAPFYYRNSSIKAPVADDFMYAFKYNNPLPLHGTDTDIIDFTVEDEGNKEAIAVDFLKELEQIIQAKDAQKFASLFIETGVWRDKLVFTWDYRTFNTPAKIQKAATDLFLRTATSNYKFIDPQPSIERPYPDLAWLQIVYTFDTDLARASAVLNLVKTKTGYKIWTLHTVIEGLQGCPEIPRKDGHMTGFKSWYDQRAEVDNLKGVEPEVIVIGGGHCGLQISARLKALGVTTLLIERNKRIGDNWRNRYEYLSLHLPHWGDHFPYFPFPDHWPTYTPAGKMVTVTRGTGEDKYSRIFYPKQVIFSTSLAGVPFIPEIPGMESFKGTIRHSSQHDSAREWVGKKVLVVGTSSSGFDTAFDFACRNVDVTLLQRSPSYVMSLDESVPRIIAPLYEPKNGKRPDLDAADRIAHGLPVGPHEELFRRAALDIWNADIELIAKMEEAGFRVWRGQRDTGPHTLTYTRNGAFYLDAGACKAVIDGKIKIEQGYISRFKENSVILDSEREKQYDLVVLATGFSNTVESVRQVFGNEIADQFKPIWGIDEEGELNAAWKFTDVKDLWLMVGSLQPARFHSQKMALRIKAILDGISPAPYLD
ncbi:unnamed protein product [Clonostachys rosea]|uniref:FAD/NAD(P)-binding domain-containing protein n=1 Tax=Bionectria ochroleuca TaxID=29856 RepID=A0ABY6UJ54_BIOOC|nr:unnamed protein product [Clonostachys rosea]